MTLQFVCLFFKLGIFFSVAVVQTVVFIVF